MEKLDVGSNAPSFKLKDQNSVERSLGEAKKLVLYFYPRDFTPGCSIELADFAKLYEKFKEKGFVVFGVSDDSVDSHKKFCNVFKSSFPLLSDEAGVVAKSYGVWKNKGIFGEGVTRSTFVIENGVIKQAFYNVKALSHAKSVLESL